MNLETSQMLMDAFVKFGDTSGHIRGVYIDTQTGVLKFLIERSNGVLVVRSPETCTIVR